MTASTSPGDDSEDVVEMPSVFVSGAGRGLGLEFVRQYAAEDWDVLAACCDPQSARDLDALGRNVSVLALDLADDRSIDELLRIISQAPLDVLIANTGVESGLPETAGAVTREAWAGVVGVNTFGPFRLATALRSNLQRGSHKKLVGISSLAASLTRCEAGGRYLDRASKAALNSLWRSLSIEWRQLGIACILLCPEPRAGTALDPERSVQGMRRVIADATMSDTGRFLGCGGNEIPW
jgi:NAD(P)-dependent dehydrogenase (short-subunit alcohol dehydrogenase family)